MDHGNGEPRSSMRLHHLAGEHERSPPSGEDASQEPATHGSWADIRQRHRRQQLASGASGGGSPGRPNACAWPTRVPEANDLPGRRVDRLGGLLCAAYPAPVAELAALALALALALGCRPTIGRLAPLSTFGLDMRWCVVRPRSQCAAAIVGGTECASLE